jgi:hypothetical protein
VSEGSISMECGGRILLPLDQVVVGETKIPVLLVQPGPRVQFGRLRTLRSFHADSARMGALTRRHPGVRTIEVACIIGSESRAHDFGPDFRRRGEQCGDPREEQRCARVLGATQRRIWLPPIVASTDHSGRRSALASWPLHFRATGLPTSLPASPRSVSSRTLTGSKRSTRSYGLR